MTRSLAHRSHAWPLLLVCSTLGSGCFASDPRAEYAESCGLYASNTCDALARCGPDLVETAYGTLEACRAGLSASCGQNVLLPDAFASTRGVEACAAQMALVECPAILNRELPAACQPPQGRRQDGARCQAGAQCASARCAKASPETLEGSCRELEAIGGGCASSDDCALGLVCGSAGVCIQLARVAEACSEQLPCRVPLTCLRGRCEDLEQPSTTCDALHPCSPDDVDQADRVASCDRYAAALCGRLASCSARFVESVYGDAAGCSARLSASCVVGLRAPDFSASTIGLNACAEVTESADCAGLFDNLPAAECSLAPGARADGQLCGSDAQCASTRCAIAADAPCGVCGPIAQLNEPCRAASDCAPGSICSSAGSCQRPGASGASCDPSHPCAWPLTCAANSCRPGAGVGERCDSAADSCDRYTGLYCDPSTSTCRAWVAAAPGQPCGPLSTGLAVCTAGSSCQLSGATALCQPAVADGEACTPGAAISCRAPARCIANRCQLASPEACP